MTLQRINRVQLRDFRSWRGDHEFTFEADETVIFGPNGAGKSSLWTGIVLGLLYKLRSKTIFESIKPIGGGSGNPYVEIDFIADGSEYRIEKTFANDTTASSRLLNLETREVLEEGDLAVLKCRSLVTGNDDQDINTDKSRKVDAAISAATKGQVIDLILPRQGNLNFRPDENESLSQIGLEPSAESTNEALKSIIEWVKIDAKNILSQPPTKDGNLSKNAQGKLKEKTDSSKLVIKKEEELISKSNDLETLIEQLNQLEFEGKGELSEETTQEKIDALRKDAEEHKKIREDADRKVKRCEEAVSPLQKQYDDSLLMTNKFSKIDKDIGFAKGQKNESIKIHDAAIKALKVSDAQYSKLETELKCINEWILFSQRNDALVSKSQEYDNLMIDDKTYQEIVKNVANIENQLNSIKLPSDKQWKRIRQIGEKISAIKGAADAWLVTEFAPGAEHRIFIDDKEMIDSPNSVNTSIEVRDKDNNSRIKMENTTSLNQISVLETEREDIFNKLSATKGTKELNKRKAEHDNLKGKLQIQIQRQDDINIRMTMEERKKKLASLSEELKLEIKAPTSSRPNDEDDWILIHSNLQEEKSRHYSNLEGSREVESDANTNKATLNSKVDVLVSQRNELEEQIEAHVELFGDFEGIRNKLAEKNVALEQANSELSPLNDSKEAHEVQKQKMAQNLQNQLSEGRKLRREISDLQAKIEDRRKNGGLGELLNISAERASLQDEIEVLSTEYNALQALLKVSIKVKNDNIEAIRPKVENTIKHGASYVFGREVEVILGEDGFPKAIEHIKGQSIPFESESFGTQEQLNIIYRVALANIISGEEGHGLCLILDDPFGDTDVHRRERMIQWIGAELNKYKHQLILLTCRGSDFDGFGNHDDIRQH
jgi:hypothetical protein